MVSITLVITWAAAARCRLRERPIRLMYPAAWYGSEAQSWSFSRRRAMSLVCTIRQSLDSKYNSFIGYQRFDYKLFSKWQKMSYMGLREFCIHIKWHCSLQWYVQRYHISCGPRHISSLKTDIDLLSQFLYAHLDYGGEIRFHFFLSAVFWQLLVGGCRICIAKWRILDLARNIRSTPLPGEGHRNIPKEGCDRQKGLLTWDKFDIHILFFLLFFLFLQLFLWIHV